MKKLFAIAFMIHFFVFTMSGQNTIQGSFNHDGITRDYVLYVPAVYNHTTQAPLVINLHGYGSNATQQMFYSNFMPIADTAGFLVVHPNGTLDPNNTRHWNTFGLSSVDDVGFLSDLIDTVALLYSVDKDRVYSTGMSNGGFMSYSLACSLSHRIAAIASVTGTMIHSNLSACNPAGKVPVMQIHGTADGTVPYAGNAMFVSVPNIVDFWVSHNGCTTPPVVTQLPDIDTTDGCTAVHYRYPDGQNGVSVELYKVDDGGHTWPGAPVVIGVTNMDFSASDEIWRFFRQYNVNGLITRMENQEPLLTQTRVWPNPSSGSVKIMFPDDRGGVVTVINLNGKVLVEYQIDSKLHKIDLSAKGLYLIKTMHNENHEIHKVVRL